ncbi:MAG TPA: threonine--tRNA ligase [bacterium]|nr:threonine--tRNA ligase [bacterium]HPT29647.1 threonine--tRNA ligase [bacterium]
MANNDLELKRHSWAHILAAAIRELYPEAKLAIGPAIDNGFYYDIDFGDHKFSDTEFANVEKKMRGLVAQGLDFVRTESDIDTAIAAARQAGDTYKEELISDLKKQGETKVSFYQVGNFIDLCRGPHVANTKELDAKSFKLHKLAGAYWRGDEKNKMLTRIYGLAFADKTELDEYLNMISEAEKRDHRKLGKELELFMLHEYAPGMPFFLPKGMVMIKELTEFIREYSYGPGYNEVRTPQILNADLWKVSGHWEHYQEDMFCLHHHEDNVDFGIKPMNCPAHMLVFKNKIHSYKELPLRLAETTTLYRNEKSGTLHGLTRVRSLSQDDSHIFLQPSQIGAEIADLLQKIKNIYQVFNLQIDAVYLSTRPEKFLGDKADWDLAENYLKEALNNSGLNYIINEGDGAFYGPKIDVQVKDALGRLWQLATIQLDYQMPQRFGLTYDDADGGAKTPVVVHRALLGSIERFMGVIIEHFAGAMPLWLSPLQVKIITIGEGHIAFANDLARSLEAEKIRVEVDSNNETVGNKIRKASAEKIPYVVVIGDEEMSSGVLAVRLRGEKENRKLAAPDLIAELVDKIKKRQL